MPPYFVLTRLGKCYNPEHGARLDQLVPSDMAEALPLPTRDENMRLTFLSAKFPALALYPLSHLNLHTFCSSSLQKGHDPSEIKWIKGWVLHTIGRDHRVTSCHVLVSTVVQNEWIYERYQAEILILCVWDESSPLSLLAGGQLQFASLKAPKTFVS